MKKVLVAILIVAAIAVSYTLGRRRPQQELKAGGARRVLYYVDPMHPAYKSDKPGIAPDCGMPLEPVYGDEPGETSATTSPPAAAPPGTINLSSEKQQLIGVRTVP